MDSASTVNRIPLICVVGPTASGKTSLGVYLCERFGGEVVSADSMQIYKGMDIATAKPTEEETHGIPHHLIGFLPPSESFSVAQYVQRARECIADIHARGRLPVVVGGTGLYVDSLLNNITFAEDNADYALREELAKKAREQGVSTLIDELAEFDPQSAQSIHPNNVKRVIRAIEVYRTTGVTMTQWRERSRENPPPYRAVKVGLKSADRQFLYDRINRRVDDMLERGLAEEAREVLSSPLSETAGKAIGYKELAPYINGETTLECAAENLKTGTRRYAKRQLTWFLRDKGIQWYNIDEYERSEQLERDVYEYCKVGN